MTTFDVPVFIAGNPKHGDIVRVSAADADAAKVAAIATASADEGIEGTHLNLEAGDPVVVS